MIVFWSVILRARPPPLAQWAAAASRSQTTTCSSSLTLGQGSRLWLRSALPQRLKRVALLSSQRQMKWSLSLSPHWTLNQPASMGRAQSINRKSVWASPSPESQGLKEHLPPLKAASLLSTAAVWLSRLILPAPCCPLLDMYFDYNTAPTLLCCSRRTTVSNIGFRVPCCLSKLLSPTCQT